MNQLENRPENHRNPANASTDQPARPGEAPTVTQFEKEEQGHEGTLGGQAPLHAPAGIQRSGRGGVLVEEGALAGKPETPRP
ncbi:hypothetical protein I5R65_05465 [Herbaspirillum sp. AP02]|uniref:hypothetical protein n=1 Tax=unclassified Herbaspirillum TaxID=2624150 RepID=UPI0015DAA8B7|nr:MULTISPECIES: hypothetical protein [unclassified Herbaspirillum]MBG7618905.1 hypothetical protein [Herbaspirillum sp. AP02]NZD67293.1 hypothetical protein [Herbaspirillum sp. AP21]